MSTPNQFTVPNATEYGGDEVSAIVLDPGYSTTRAGFAGEDVPKSVVPTYYGVLNKSENEVELLFGENSLHNPVPSLEIRNPLLSDCSEDWVEDWETASKLWEYSITSRLAGRRSTDPKNNGLNDPNDDAMDVDVDAMDDAEKALEDNPLLMTEPSRTSSKTRERAIETAIEGWGVPAFWLGRSGVLAAFSAGKSNALVVDVGASTTTVTPVIDGMLLKKGVRVSPLAGNFVSQQIRLMFASSQTPVSLTPHYMVLSKAPVEVGQPSQAVYRKFAKPPTESFRRWEEERVLTEFKESVVQLWGESGRLSNGVPLSLSEDFFKDKSKRIFEMPDGWNQDFTLDSVRPAEGLFDEKAALVDSDHPRPQPEHTIPNLIKSALGSCDTEVRPLLMNNVVVVGAGSLTQYFVKRLEQELVAMYAGPRVRIYASGNTVERKYASWIGGSILGSLGTFHQMWISKKEYEEHGANIVEKRCK
ncbi:Actin/actin-like protein [Trichodelitschia bisporula]|uniref:Actin/actin-like protein n=1 Tax=Trichodelitschia bisporula TaxID=703511 RepID=A0A6G1HV53_9PEZI|nr:Actin/actin-like protein [Trichodelitschia bisporula]